LGRYVLEQPDLVGGHPHLHNGNAVDRSIVPGEKKMTSRDTTMGLIFLGHFMKGGRAFTI
jgi:hypothetical protein